MRLALAFLLACAPLTAQGAQLDSWQLGISLRAATSWGNSAEFAEATVSPALEWRLSDRARLRLSARGRHNNRRVLDTPSHDLGAYSDLSRPRQFSSKSRLELRDLYIDYYGHGWTARVGKHQLVWGNLDGLKVLDRLNPQTLREFILDDFGSSRIGLWSLAISKPIGRSQLDFAWIPDPTVNELPAVGSAFEFRAPRFRFGQPPGSAGNAVTAYRMRTKLIEDGSYAVRWSAYHGRWNLSLQALSGLDPDPVAEAAPADSVKLIHRRRLLFGTSVELSIAKTVLRTEVAYEPDIVLNAIDTHGLRITEPTGRWRGAIGMDWQAPGNFFVNLQFLVDRVGRAPQGLLRPIEDRLATVFLRWQSPYARWSTALRWYRSLHQGDGLVRPSFRYAISDRVNVELGVDVFYGDVTGIFGQFNDQDRVVLGVGLGVVEDDRSHADAPLGTLALQALRSGLVRERRDLVQSSAQ